MARTKQTARKAMGKAPRVGLLGGPTVKLPHASDAGLSSGGYVLPRVASNVLIATALERLP